MKRRAQEEEPPECVSSDDEEELPQQRRPGLVCMMRKFGDVLGKLCASGSDWASGEEGLPLPSPDSPT